LRVVHKNSVLACAQAYLEKVLLASIVDLEKPPLPLAFLQYPTPLQKLLHLSKKELVSLINALAMYDLAEELRQIVETKNLKRIYSLLSEEEKNQLKSAGKNKESVSFGKMGLERLDSSEEAFRVALHRRGILRLAVGISGQDLD